MDATLSDSLPGQLLDGRYHVESRVAQGGMATVYRALDTRLDRTVAIKVMNAELARDRHFVSRFITEAKSAAALTHPNVVAVYDQGADAGRLYLAMEYVPGRTLRDLLHQRGRLTPRQAFYILEPVLRALSAAHEAGLVHRDVKPENILLADDGRIKVADFGLARMVTSATESNAGQLLGTVSYLAPEQVEHGHSDHRSDVYAAGIVLFEMLTGSKPRTGDNPVAVIYQHVHEDVPAPSERVPGLSRRLDQLVARAADRDPDGRPANAAGMLAEVRQVRMALTDPELDLRPETGSFPTASEAADEATTALGVVGAAASLDDQTTVVRREGYQHTTVLPVPPGGPPAPRPPGPPQPWYRQRGPVTFWSVVLLATVLAGVAFLVGRAQLTSVPDLTGRTVAEARALARQAGLTAQAEPKPSVFSETVPAGRVADTDPGPGGLISDGGTVTLRISRGSEQRRVPKLKGLSQAAAGQALDAAYLRVGSVREEFDEDAEPGTVISSSPGSGTTLRYDSKVDLVVSKGGEPVEVPDVSGLPLGAAKAMLAAKGLKAKVASEVYSDSVRAGWVVSQDPESGTRPRGSAVRLTVSKGQQLVAVPDVLGLSVKKAEAKLKAAGFHVLAIDPPFGGDVVTRQSPDGGERKPKGSTVTISTF